MSALQALAPDGADDALTDRPVLGDGVPVQRSKVAGWTKRGPRRSRAAAVPSPATTARSAGSSAGSVHLASEDRHLVARANRWPSVATPPWAPVRVRENCGRERGPARSGTAHPRPPPNLQASLSKESVCKDHRRTGLPVIRKARRQHAHRWLSRTTLIPCADPRVSSAPPRRRRGHPPRAGSRGHLGRARR